MPMKIMLFWEGRERSLKDICKLEGISYDAVAKYKAYYKDMSIEKIIDRFISLPDGGNRKVIELDGKLVTAKNYCKAMNWNYNQFRNFKKYFSNKKYNEVASIYAKLSQDKIYMYIHFWNSWQCMMDRCYNPNSANYKYYGGKKPIPVKVCKRWHEFENFKIDMWSSYLDYIKVIPIKDITLNRKKPSEDYCLYNCEWADWKKQGEDKSSTIYYLPCGTLNRHCVNNNYNYMTITKLIKDFGYSADKALAIYLEKKSTN